MLSKNHWMLPSAFLMLLAVAATSWAAQVTLDFDSTGLAGDVQVPVDFAYAGFTFNYGGTDGWYHGPGYGVGGSNDFYADEFNYFDVEVRMKRTDGMEFYFISADTRGPFGDTVIDFYGYQDGVQIYGPTSVDCLAPFATNTFHWQNVDEIRILKSGSNEFAFDFDNFRYDDAPTVKSVQVVDAHTVDVTFNKAVTTGQLTTTNYVLSGSGQGTLPANPNSVDSQGGNTYRLTWISGHMVLGGDITITVSNVQ
ncbi:MAG TPA: hypothetical protein ENN80_03410, partial [Candidatus Hydrogenedentes bacterium]|nr:hypothetical protein [Candidatus Hydrogenedentota bacterium]